MYIAQLITKNLSTGVILFTLVAYFLPSFFANCAFLTSYLLGFVMFAMALNLKFPIDKFTSFCPRSFIHV